MINRMNRVNGRLEEDTSPLASAVRYDADQIRSEEEKAQARANMGAISAAQLADTKADLEEQIENISGISDPEAVSQMVENVAKHETDISALKSNFAITFTLSEGFYNESGLILSPTQYNERYTNKIGCVPNQKFTITVKLPSANGLQMHVIEFDRNGKFVRRVGGAYGWVAEYTEDYTVPSGVYAIAFQYRQFTGGVLTVECTNWSQFITSVTAPSDTVVRDFRLQNSAFDVSVKGIAHSGYYLGPENTLPAYKLAKKNGFTFAECDLQMTSDNVPVLLHDNTINRTGRNADGTTISSTISIWDVTYAHALTYDFGIYKGSEFAGTKIPTLEEFIVLCKNLNMRPYIELKGNWTPARTKIAYDIVKKYYMESNVTWISSSLTFLRNVKDLDEYARLSYIMETITSSALTDLASLYTEHNALCVMANYANLTSETLALVENAPFPLEVYTVNSEETMLSMDGYISGVTSDMYDYARVLLADATGE